MARCEWQSPDAAAAMAEGDESLLLYRAICSVRRSDGSVTHVVSNGDQTDTIAAGLANGETFATAFATSRRRAGPTALHGAHRRRRDRGRRAGQRQLRVWQSSSASAASGPRLPANTSATAASRPGWGHCITTYEADGSPLPPFAGEPFVLPLATTPRLAVQELWEMLDRNNRVSAAAKFIDPTSGVARIEIINRNPHDGRGTG